MKYGIKTVVGGFGRGMSAEEAIPYTLARTYIEHQELRNLLETQAQSKGLEVGCGYGRNLPVLNEFIETVGIERDEELFGIAAALNPGTSIFCGTLWQEEKLFEDDEFDFILTFTFLQHLTPWELGECAKEIERITCKDSYTTMILCEETDPGKTDSTCFSRTILKYQSLFPGFQLINTRPRKVEATFPGENSGSYMVFRRR